eukprot:CAMPEP_0197705430 /NCGR_PEP_ID=MMETSP1338-20131121/126438_1 /TAXON_ID=43686 ORGANISM="Pelagodinium beii, Strain RCC1491" /NCGR_SAMPLE_ID=MMETSP1338 /ASSEMBLY_ACC=CAM_ASM_000754 /LENGTH=112 /DNA_ID=CAMNT_0043289339 /DNA_START=653 /DNA_END=988 /DNA_ORIENTATION=-
MTAKRGVVILAVLHVAFADRGTSHDLELDESIDPETTSPAQACKDEGYKFMCCYNQCSERMNALGIDRREHTEALENDGKEHTEALENDGKEHTIDPMTKCPSECSKGNDKW